VPVVWQTRSQRAITVTDQGPKNALSRCSNDAAESNGLLFN